jgi:hypothetical protein
MPNQRPKSMKSFAELQRSVTPMLGNEGERVPWTWFHRVNYVSGTTTQLTFFNVTGVPTTTNMDAGGQIPAPMYYDIYHLGIYFDLPVSTLNAAGTLTIQGGALNDVVNLSDGIARLTVAQKLQFFSPIWQLPPGVGAFGQLAAAGTFTAEDYNVFQQGTQGVPDLRNRYNFWGDITLPHNQSFFLQLDWAAAVTLNNGNTDIIAILDGYLYRRVL